MRFNFDFEGWSYLARNVVGAVALVGLIVLTGIVEGI